MKTDESASRVKRLPGVLRVLLFLAIFAVLFFFANKILFLKSDSQYYLASANEEPGTVDMATIGSSHVYHALYSMQLFRDYGIASVNQGISGQKLDLTTVTAEEVIRRHHPKMLVMDVYQATRKTRSTTGTAHKMFDNMLDLPLKFRTVTRIYSPKHWEEYLLPFSLYHNRWEEINGDDFKPVDLLCKGSLEEVTHAFRGKKSKLLSEFRLIDRTEKGEIAPDALAYLEQVRDLCRENNVELLLVVLPYIAPEEDQLVFNRIEDWCGENRIGYVNYLYLMDEIGFDLETGMRDQGHINYFGGRVMTDVLGKYLTENYDLPDRRGDPKYASWEDRIPAYNAYLKEAFEKIGETYSNGETAESKE